MDQDVLIYTQKILTQFIPVAVFLAVFLGGLLLRRIIFGRLSRWARNTKSEIDDIIIAATRGPFIVWSLMLGLFFALETSYLPDEAAHILNKLLLVLGMLSVTFALANMSSRLTGAFSGKFEAALPVTSLTRNISRKVIFCIGILIILNSLGISITPILATLGVGGLAVALALQDTFPTFLRDFMSSPPGRSRSAIT